MIRVLLVGAGSLGSVVLWRLKAGGQDQVHVTAVCRSNYADVKADGYHFESKIFGEAHWHPDSVVGSVEEAVKASNAPFDYVLVALKALPNLFSGPYMVAPAIRSPHTCIALIQNGLGIEEPYAREFPNNPLISVVSYLDAHQSAPGYVQHGLMATIALGLYSSDPTAAATITGAPASHARAAQVLRDMWARSGVQCLLADNIQKYRWLKQIHNAVFNPMSVLSGGKDVGSILRHPALSKVAHKAMQEVWDAGLVVTGGGIYPYIEHEDSIENLVKRVLARSVPLWTSMWRDYKARRPLEHQVIVKNTIDIAAKYGIAMPHLETIYAHLVVLEEAYLPNTPPP